MHRRFATFLAGILLTAGMPAVLQAQTLARLAHEATPDLSRSNTTPSINSHQNRTIGGMPLLDSALSRQAAHALFVDSNVDRASQLSARVLRRNQQDGEALFVRMEVAGMEADPARVVQSALRLCEVGSSAPGDPRVRLAAARIRELAANTPAFRNAIPRLQVLLASSQEPWPDLHEALLNAAMDGVPALDPYAIARASGILTDWRMVGPLGVRPLLDQQPVAPSDDLAQDSYQNRRVENFQFPDGRILLPGYMSRHGVFYAATGFSSLTAGRFTVSMESAGVAEVYADGKRVLRDNSRGSNSVDVDLAAGSHRILLKFIASSAPLRIALRPALEPAQATLPKRISLQEATYLLAAEDYAAGEFHTAASQIAGVAESESSAALQFLAQAAMRSSHVLAYTTAWDSPHISPPDKLAANIAADDETTALSQRVAAHPSCKTLLTAMAFYRRQGDIAAARSSQQKLDGCAPESLDYARSLSNDGNHAAAARALEGLLAAAPLNRAARQMLVRELQLSGDDQQAQRAAAEWLRIAPNAENYRRLAAGSSGLLSEQPSAQTASPNKDFYQPYRRDASVIARQAATASSPAESLELVDDHVAIVRPDGSVSLYVHTARHAFTEAAAAKIADSPLPRDAQVIAVRVIHSNGSATAVVGSTPALAAGDTIDAEYLLHYAGDGGIPEHPEVFQFVFGSFDEQVLHARFVVLMPAARADRGVVIASGDYPAMTVRVRNGMVERMWQEDASENDSALGSGAVLGIVRLVEQENGWTVPSNAEHHRRIETIHPGPRPQDS